MLSSLILPIALLVAQLPAQAAESQREPGLAAFAERFDRAQIEKNGAALETMVDDELVFIDGFGKRFGKRDFINRWIAPGDVFNPITLVDRVVVPLGDDAGSVSAETVFSGTASGKPFSRRFRFTDTFRRVGGEWRAVHIQVTFIPEASPQ